MWEVLVSSENVSPNEWQRRVGGLYRPSHSPPENTLWLLWWGHNTFSDWILNTKKLMKLLTATHHLSQEHLATFNSRYSEKFIILIWTRAVAICSWKLSLCDFWSWQFNPASTQSWKLGNYCFVYTLITGQWSLKRKMNRMVTFVLNNK